MVEKIEAQYNVQNYTTLEKNARAAAIMQQAIGEDEFDKISTNQTAKGLWDAVQLIYEGSSEVKHSRIDLLTTQYELFSMSQGESIKEMFTRFKKITNELNSFGKVFSPEDLVRKILCSLDERWIPKVTAIEICLGYLLRI